MGALKTESVGPAGVAWDLEALRVRNVVVFQIGKSYLRAGLTGEPVGEIGEPLYRDALKEGGINGWQRRQTQVRPR